MNDPKEETEPSQNDAGYGPRFDARDDLNSRMTSVTAPDRARLAIRAKYTNPTIARSKVDLNDGWVPVSTQTRLVQR
jgi:hypothetical protein